MTKENLFVVKTFIYALYLHFRLEKCLLLSFKFYFNIVLVFWTSVTGPVYYIRQFLFTCITESKSASDQLHFRNSDHETYFDKKGQVYDHKFNLAVARAVKWPHFLFCDTIIHWFVLCAIHDIYHFQSEGKLFSDELKRTFERGFKKTLQNVSLNILFKN